MNTTDTTYIKCDGCGQIIDIPPELLGDMNGESMTAPYFCDACEMDYWNTDSLIDPWGFNLPDMSDFLNDDEEN